MKRKAQSKPEQVVPAEILEQAKRSVSEDRLNKKTPRCAVCGAETSMAGPEPLCWVCRRLKVSAWREIEQQPPAQE
jgi:ribosomal protein S27AE